MRLTRCGAPLLLSELRGVSQGRRGDGSGCAGLFAVLLVFGAVIAAGISLAALVDPFAWMPPLAEIWADCDDDYATSEDECSLEVRYDGFWVHAAINVAYALITGVLLLAFASAVAEFREARRERFAGDEAAGRYAVALSQFVGGSAAVAIVAAIPPIVATI